MSKLPITDPSFQMLCLGSGKSAFFFASQTPRNTNALILTDHTSPSSQVYSYNGDRIISCPQTDDIAKARQFIKDGIAKNTLTTIIVTTNPERGKWWLDRLLADPQCREVLQKNPTAVCFVLPQSPNPFLENFAETKCRVVELDYYPGIGGVRHENGVARVVAGVKENTNYVEVNSQPQDSNIQRTIQTLCGGWEIRRLNEIAQINLPTNAFLHTVGIVVHIAEELVNKAVIDATILQAKTSREFFEKFNAALDGKTVAEINQLLGNSLAGKGFYRQMPQVGPNVLMREMGDVVCETRKKLIKEGKMEPSFLDEKGEGDRNHSHIFNHLKAKYAQQYAVVNGCSPYDVSFGEFINNNPPYQNRGIVFPTNENGTINIAHRFFTEELPTIRMMEKQGRENGIPAEQLEVFAQVTRFCERLVEPSRIMAPTAIAIVSRYYSAQQDVIFSSHPNLRTYQKSFSSSLNFT